MPNRIIKESICTSDRISRLTDFEFRLWIGLIVSADDAGRGDARPAIIKGRVFPLRDRLTIKDIDAAIHGLADKGCVSLYTVDGKPYFYFPTWGEHQRIREVKPKYPSPEDADPNNAFSRAFDNPPQSAANCGELRPESNPIQSESNPNPRESKGRFAPPSLAEVQGYCAERGNKVDPQRFIDYYTANGWKVGKNAMKDWKAAVRSWERNGYSSKPAADAGIIKGNTDYDSILHTRKPRLGDGI